MASPAASDEKPDGSIHLRIDKLPRERASSTGTCSRRRSIPRWAPRASGEYRSGIESPWLIEKAEAIFLPKIDEELLAEIDGMVEGLGVAGVKTSRGEMIAYNAITELTSSGGRR